MIAILLLTIGTGCAPAKPTESKITLNCREEPALAEGSAKQMIDEGWTYAGPMYNNGINCTAVLWTR